MTGDAIDMVLLPPTRDLGDGFTVRRALPSAMRRMVGPFIFFDHLGPATIEPGHGFDVRPHPHVGLATLTYLIDGEILHRDSIGTVQTIKPRDVNWMTTGSGIVHSERTPADARRNGGDLFGIQAWVALPTDKEEIAPSFASHAAATLPGCEAENVSLSLLVGELEGMRSPVATLSDMIYAEIVLTDGGRYRVAPVHVEQALYVLNGELRIDGQEEIFGEGQLVLLKPGAEVVIRAAYNHAARVMLLGGEPVGPRHISWNFVSSSPDRIVQAKRDWTAGRFGTVPGDAERIPLPDELAA